MIYKYKKPYARHDKSLSPDPLFAQPHGRVDGAWQIKTLYPNAITHLNSAENANVECAWNQPFAGMTLFPEHGEAECVVDFGTEFEGSLVVEMEGEEAGCVAVSFGENEMEARELGQPSRCKEQRPRKVQWFVQAGHNHKEFEEGGFRFARLWFFGFKKPLVLKSLQAEARFMFPRYQGAFTCENKALQQLWYCSAYTARLCTRPDAYWDGIKRDRVGWYGDARITQQATDAAFFGGEPAENMLLNLQTDAWANGIPNYSFDAVAMLKQLILVYGADRPLLTQIYSRMQAFMNWALQTQTTKEGLIQHTANTHYFFNIGFLDWTPQPLGGRLEELACLQFAWLSCLRDAAQIAGWLGCTADAKNYQAHHDNLKPLLKKRFRVASGGYHHTLNLSVPPETSWEMPITPNLHYQTTYEEGQQFGPSGPSLHSAAQAVFAGLVDPNDAADMLSLFSDPRLPAIVTTYYQYYVLHARSLLGDASNAFSELIRFFLPMLEKYDSPTILETFEPHLSDGEMWSMGGSWPRSQCHGWGTCAVPMIQSFLAGITILEPGFSQIQFAPSPALPWAFELEIPTIHGSVRVSRTKTGGPVKINAPEKIQVLEVPHKK